MEKKELFLREEFQILKKLSSALWKQSGFRFKKATLPQDSSVSSTLKIFLTQMVDSRLKT